MARQNYKFEKRQKEIAKKKKKEEKRQRKLDNQAPPEPMIEDGSEPVASDEPDAPQAPGQ